MRIAITGTIGSGKSEVSNYLRTKSYDVFDCDKYNAYLLKKNSKAYIQLQEAFPDCYEKGKLNKKKLSHKVFTNKTNKKKLESILHPLILEKLFNKKDDPLFAEVPLLFEVNWDKYFDYNILVVSDEKILIKRLINRGLDIEDIKNRLKNQMSVKEKIKRADKIIYNNGSLKDLYKSIDKVLKEIL